MSSPIIKPIVANNISTALRFIIVCSSSLKANVICLINKPKIIKNTIIPMSPSI